MRSRPTEAFTRARERGLFKTVLVMVLERRFSFKSFTLEALIAQKTGKDGEWWGKAVIFNKANVSVALVSGVSQDNYFKGRELK